MEFIIKRKVFISMLFAALTLLGIISYRQLAVEIIPEAELPMLYVQVSGQTETDPAYIENQLIIPLEGAVSTLEGIEKLESFAESRSGSLVIYYTQNTDIKYAYLKLQEKVDALKSSLPDGFTVQVVKVDTEQLANQFMGLQVRGSGGVDRVRNIVDEEVTPELENIDGIANVEVFGGREKTVEVILNEEACRAAGVTPSQIRNIIRQNGEIRSFVGQAWDRHRRYFVNVTAEYTDIRNLEDIIVNQQGPILLKDVAEIFFGVKDQTSLSRVNGKEAVTVQLVRDARVNLIDLSHITQKVIKDLNAKLAPQDIEVVIQSNEAETMEKNIDLIISLALIGGVLAVLILWMFLRNFTLVLTIALAMPISIFTALNLFYAFHITLNSLTLVGIALAIGMLLDNSVVVLENIYRLASLKRDPQTAVVQGASEVWRSVVAATLTTIAVFLPFIFTSDSVIRLLGRNIAFSIISTLVVSLAVALLVVPMVTHYFLSRNREKGGPIFQKVSQKNRLVQLYTVLLKTGMRFPFQTILAALALFFISLIACLSLVPSTTSEVETSEINLYVTMPGGATLDKTDLVVADIEARLDDLPEKEDIISKIYEDEAIVTVNLKDNFEKIEKRNAAQIKNIIEDRVDDIRSAEIGFEQPQSSRRFRGGGGSNPGASLERMMGMGAQQEKVVIIGSDFESMRNVADDIEYYLEDLSTISSVSVNISDNTPEVHLALDLNLMSQNDIPLTSISSELNSFTNQFTSGLTFKQDDEEYDITIRMDVPEDDEDKIMDDLESLEIPSSTGATYPLSQLSQIYYSTGMSTINRVDQEKQIEVTYRFEDDVNSSKALLESARMEVEDVVAGLTLPAGMAVEVVHDERDFSEFYFLIGAAVILILMILASVFESLFLPFVIMFSIPFAATGSFLALMITGTSLLNVNVLTGMVILLGVVVNNGIILIDYVRILRQRGTRKSRALIMAGQARLRPILITAITTIVGMMPLAMGKAEYVTQIGAPFAITVIGGLLVSTMLTLIFIPTVYSGLESSMEWMRQLSWKIKGLMALLMAGGLLLVYTGIQTFLWQVIVFIVLLIAIPASVYFVMTSLRKASAEIIPADVPITISIRNLVKVYDRKSRFVREWTKGRDIIEHAGRQKKYRKVKDFEDLVWQVPFMAFLVYFTYFFISRGFWVFALSHAVYFFGFYMLGPLDQYSAYKTSKTRKKIYRRVYEQLSRIFFWGFPLLNLVIFQVKWGNAAVTIFIGLVWYLALTVYTTSNHLHHKGVRIERITGRFSGLRRKFYRFVMMIPIIGRKKVPFRALDQASMEIGKGMFGLLGPNGAGKSTMMRIVTGILEQSYGKIEINGIDVNEKREELQGLIGYLPQEFGMYENMTAYEFLQYQAILKNLTDPAKREKRVLEVLEAVHMAHNRDAKIGSFSGGMKQRIGIAQILLHLPRILVVDEPTSGLDPRERIRFRNLLVELSRDRIVIFSTHIIEDISSSCNKVAVLNRGQLKFLGDPARMTDAAEGRVWQFRVPINEFDSIARNLLIIHHMRDGDSIRIRCLSAKKPAAQAVTVKPTLEDAYLWLLKKESME
ncbi:efflux RND transporter permease subunit [bacterium]|nr:efflux RND transporter permease subunit [bacterium]